MALVLPSTVEEINFLQITSEPVAILGSHKEANQAFENITVEKRFKREISLPNGVQNWNISDFNSYLNFEENVIGNAFPVDASADDRVVPEEGDQGGRCSSFSSVSSSMDDKCHVFHNFGIKTFNTVRQDSGSTCISSDHSYVVSNSTIFKGLDPEETYQNLDTFLQEVPDVTNTDTLSSSFSSVPSPGSNDSNYELTVVQNSLSLQSHDTFNGKISSLKRPLETYTEDEVFILKQTKREFEPTGDGRYHEIRRKNNIASKNCRKTRKEKQREMEQRVMELEKEKESLKVEVQVLEEMIQAQKSRLYAILQKR